MRTPAEDRIIAAAAGILERERLAAEAEAAQAAAEPIETAPDPLVQKRWAEHQAAEATRLKREIADLRTLAKGDPSESPWKVLPTDTGDLVRDRESARLNAEMTRTRSWFMCGECKRNIAGNVHQVGAGMLLCGPCFARHRLACDDPQHDSKQGEVLTKWCSDNRWRCDACAAEFLAHPPPPAAPAAVFFPR